MSATEKVVLSDSYLADVDLSTKQYFAVKLTSATNVDLEDGDGVASLGILLNQPGLAGQALVGIGGILKSVAGAAYAIDADLMVNTSGKLITATTGKRIVAKALEAAAADAEVRSVHWRPGGVAP